MAEHVDRREFLRAGAAAAVATQVAGVSQAANSSKPLRVGVIGVGGRGTYLLRLALDAGVEVPALCDIDPQHLQRAVEVVAKARDGRKPAGYANGPYDYRRMLQRDDLDAIIIGTPMQVHAPMSIDALRAGRHVLSEVAAAMTIDECWGLVRAAEETGRIYMLAENCCYMDYVMMITQMVRSGVFGPLTYAECGYVHAVPGMFFAGRNLTWRGEMVRDCRGNNYPTHSLGPVAQWMSINRGDRMVSLVAAATGNESLRRFIDKTLPADHPARNIQFKGADSVTALIRTAKGALIDLRYDIISPRPVVSTTYYSLQGVKASYESRLDSVWIEGRSKDHKWEPRTKYAPEFEHPLWKASRQQAAGSGHGGCDYFVVSEFIKAIHSGGPSPIDAYDAAAWSAVIPLSAQSLAEGGRVVEVPDFTRGKWERRHENRA
jgi:predicted dehydrogenase